MFRPSIVAVAAAVVAASVPWHVAPAAAAAAAPAVFVKMPGLKDPASVTRDVHGIAHIRAENDDDLYFMQGYVHAQDRLFQMDISRRRASGTLAELLGSAALPGDIELRTIGIRRAAERSLAVISPQARRALDAYARGVNARVASGAPLPAEYAALEITKFQTWTALDSMTVAKSIAFSLSFGLEDIDNTIALQTYSAVFDPVLGPGTGYTLFSQDLWRSAPFYAASTVPDATSTAPLRAAGTTAARTRAADASAAARAAATSTTFRRAGDGVAAAALARTYAQRVGKLPFFQERMRRDAGPGSNEWAVAGRHTASGRPLLANDPHLDLGQPSIFYPNALSVGADDVVGSSFAGAPYVVLGQTRRITWGATFSALDVTDVFVEQVVPDAASPSGLSTVHLGALEPVIPVPETFRINLLGDSTPDNLFTVPPGGGVPPVTLIVPRRNNGPIVQLDMATGSALSVQYTGFSGTRELDALRTWNRAQGLADFKTGLQWFDSGTLNFAYADVDGNIAFFAGAEVPVREDLQAMTVTGLPPWFIRQGGGGNEWLPVQNPQAGQAVPYEILPPAEMPQLLNPAAGWFSNANNDPAGTVLDNDPLNSLRPGGGLYYLTAGYDMGLRAGRVDELLRARIAAGPVTLADMQAIQADVVLPDAKVFVPVILNAFARAAVSANPLMAGLAGAGGMAEGRNRLAAWTLKSPTGIEGGYDAADTAGNPGSPTPQEVADSVATTLYSVWRGQFIANTIDATLEGVPLPPGVSLPKPGDDLTMTALKALLERPTPGVGASGLNFFNVPNVPSAADRRDILVLKSLADALGRLAGAPFAAAFNGSTNQDDYRWGRLHRITLNHPLGAPFSLPNPHPLGASLPGYPTDGGFGTVDVGRFKVRANSANDFVYVRGATNRFVAEAGATLVRAESIWPGGTSGVKGSPYYDNMLPLYLTNEAVPLLLRAEDLAGATASVTNFVPGRAAPASR